MICVEAPSRFLSKKKKPQCSEALKKELDELTLRADEVVTQKAFINTGVVLCVVEEVGGRRRERG